MHYIWDDQNSDYVPDLSFFFSIFLHEFHLYVGQTAHVWVQVVVDSLASSRQSHSSDEQNQESHIWERGCKVGHLPEKSTQSDQQGWFMEVSLPK